MKLLNIGILAFQGDVSEHINATIQAVKNLKFKASILEVRTKSQLNNLDALIIPGGESTTLQKLCSSEGMLKQIKKVKNIFGTCAGAILLSKLNLMDIEVDRNAYGRQADSFEDKINSRLGPIKAIFIRAPKIKKVGKNISIIANQGTQILACEEKINGSYFLAACFHPELTTTKFHEYFLKRVAN